MESQPQNPEFRNNPENFHSWGFQVTRPISVIPLTVVKWSPNDMHFTTFATDQSPTNGPRRDKTCLRVKSDQVMLKPAYQATEIT